MKLDSPYINYAFYAILAILGLGALYALFRKSQKKDLLKVIDRLKSKKYKIYEDGRLNIIGVRNRNYKPNTFNDELWVFWKDGKEWDWTKYTNFTTLAGLYYLKNPMNAAGCALLAEGQYLDSYKIGLHKGEYEALVQVKPVRIYRDNNQNNSFDFVNMQTGNYGINIHRASTKDSQSVDKWSAGCQVFGWFLMYQDFMRLCRWHRDRFGNTFSYTLI